MYTITARYTRYSIPMLYKMPVYMYTACINVQTHVCVCVHVHRAGQLKTN